MAAFAPPTFPMAVQLPAMMSTRSLVGSSGSVRTGSTVTLGRGKGPSSSSTLNLEKSKSRLHTTAEAAADDLPPLAYSQTSLGGEGDAGPEPRTPAWYLFWIGFVFPLAWIAGAILLMVPSTSLPCSDSEGGVYGKTSGQAVRRATAEQKWARRCLTAVGIAICFGLILGIAIWRGLESRGS